MVRQWARQVQQPQRGVADQLGRGQVRPGPPDRAEQRDRRGHPRHPDHRHRPRGRQRRHQPQPYPGQHPERALAAAEQPGQVVAGGVLERTVHPGQQRAGRQRELGGDQLSSGRAPAQHPQPTGIRGDRAADGGRVPGGPVHPELPAGRGGLPLHRGDRRTGARDHGAVRGHRRQSRQPPGGQHHRALDPGRHPAADQPGVATLRNHRHARRRAGREHRSHLARQTRPDHRSSRPAPPAGPVDLGPGLQVRVGQHVLPTDHRAERGLQHRPILPHGPARRP